MSRAAVVTRECPGIGLCADCRHARRIGNRRGSTFHLCALASSDPRFTRYPRLPVVRCAGYERGPAPSTDELA